jgi:hypothetical protein
MPTVQKSEQWATIKAEAEQIAADEAERLEMGEMAQGDFAATLAEFGAKCAQAERERCEAWAVAHAEHARALVDNYGRFGVVGSKQFAQARAALAIADGIRSGGHPPVPEEAAPEPEATPEPAPAE